MKIVIVDGYTLNPGDLTWNGIETLASEFVYYDRTSPKEVIERCKDAEVILTNKVVFNKETLAQLPVLKQIVVTATGFNIIDIIAAKAQGIIVCNAPAYSTTAVVQHTFALLFDIYNQVGAFNQTVHKGDWVASKDFAYFLSPITEVAGKTLGIIGLGDIGKAVATAAEAFGMKVISIQRPSSKPFGSVEYVDFKTLLAKSDVVSLHCPLTKDNTAMMNTNAFKQMKSHAILINTARGPLINEADLLKALRTGDIAAAGLDVISKEPMDSHSPLLNAPNCIVTPHVAWAATEARERLLAITTDNIRNFQAGTPINVVNY